MLSLLVCQLMGQYASIISTIVDTRIVVPVLYSGQYASIISTIVDYSLFIKFVTGQYASIISTIVDLCVPASRQEGQYASIISTIVDSPAGFRLPSRLVCFNNFYYCRFGVVYYPAPFRLVCFNNFYYCRCVTSTSFLTFGQYASIISTIVDSEHFRNVDVAGQYASIISTIVDKIKACTSQLFGQYASIISTIVDKVWHYLTLQLASMLQ